MRANVNLFWILGGFFFFADIVYVIWNVAFNAQGLATTSQDSPASPIEWVGSVALALSAILAWFIAFYLRSAHRAQGGTLPEDSVDGDIDDADPEMGFYSPYSWWPIILAVSVGVVFLGMMIGVWLALVGAGLLLIAIVGWTYEYYRGAFAR